MLLATAWSLKAGKRHRPASPDKGTAGGSSGDGGKPGLIVPRPSKLFRKRYGLSATVEKRDRLARDREQGKAEAGQPLNPVHVVMDLQLEGYEQQRQEHRNIGSDK